MSLPDRVYDISRTITAETAGWPGDVPFRFALSWQKSAGASVNVGAISGSVHTATHCDAPFHYDDGGDTVEQLPPETFIGLTWVVDVRGAGSWQSQLELLHFIQVPRVLFRTGGWPDSSRFPDVIPVMEPTLPAWLAERGVILVGVDVPSVDTLDSKTLDNHHALGKAKIVIIEGLWLEDVTPGLYQFIGFPLKIAGADGSPLRAVLTKPNDGRDGLKEIGFFYRLERTERIAALRAAMLASPYEDRDQIASYLNQGKIHVLSPGCETDILDPDEPIIGGMSQRTDGEWTWPDSLVYWVLHRQIGLPPDFVVKIRACGYRNPARESHLARPTET